MSGISTRAIFATIGIVLLMLIGAGVTMKVMGYKLGKAEQKIETTTDAKVAVQQEKAANTDITAKRDRLDIVVRQVQGAAHDYAAEARSAAGADEPLSDDAVARLRRNDDFLCRARPTQCEGRAIVGSAPSGHPRADPEGVSDRDPSVRPPQ